MPSVSLSLNVPGLPKSNDIVRKFFILCLDDLKYFLKARLISVNDKNAIERPDAAGDFFIAPLSVANISISEIKMICEDFEESHPLGRFIDADLTDISGNPVSSGKAKLCFYCRQKPAIECRRENTHDLNELREYMFSEMAAYCRKRREEAICKNLSSMALKSVLYEISLTPKPGLVDKLDNGSHSDMNYQTFLDSSAAISAWFTDLACEGYRYQGKDIAKALPVIRNIGLRMETDMFGVTHDVNTQKGLIFLLGIALFASGYLFAARDEFDIEVFRETVKNICSNLTGKELGKDHSAENTHGEKMYLQYGFSGARGEAESGFSTVFEFGLPVLMKYRELNNEALLKAFLSIAAHNNDTNILYRSNLQVLNYFKSRAQKIAEDFTMENYTKLIETCKNENISPGGSADLLAVSIFIRSLIQPGEKN